jgi:hypothetical protein
MIGSGLGVGPGDRTGVANFCVICARPACPVAPEDGTGVGSENRTGGIYGLISVESAKSADQAAEIFHFCRSLV